MIDKSDMSTYTFTVDTAVVSIEVCSVLGAERRAEALAAENPGKIVRWLKACGWRQYQKVEKYNMEGSDV